MYYISIKKFADMTIKNNKGLNRAQLIQSLENTLAAKENDATCSICSTPIWQRAVASPGYICVLPVSQAKPMTVMTMK